MTRAKSALDGVSVQFTNKYHLLNKGWRSTEKEIDGATRKFTNDLKRIKRKYPGCGIGDTHTDEAIVGEVYSGVHSL